MCGGGGGWQILNRMPLDVNLDKKLLEHCGIFLLMIETKRPLQQLVVLTHWSVCLLIDISFPYP